jgi:1,4-dihydroxy-6-naphthoate synthase
VSEAEAYTLAYSPCPNDTYIFAALTNGLLPDAPVVRVALADVEALNDAAIRGEYELTKVSYGAIPYLMDRYRILRSGGALGRGCGPLLIVRGGGARRLEDLRGKRIAIPGDRTTAFLLLRLAMRDSAASDFTPVEMRFDRIIPAVCAGDVDAGLIIHESRFTYRDAGLESLLDLGDWWEAQTGLPIPLGAILVRNDLDDERARTLDHSIRRSLAFARAHEDAIMGYVRAHAFEMDEGVMRKHIALYVNEFSDDLGDAGIDAVHGLFARARAAGIFEASTEPRFV